MERGLGHPLAAEGGEVKDWNEAYARGETPWDKGVPHPAWETWLDGCGSPGRWLVPGCGTGHDVRVLAARGLAVVGLDVAPLAVEMAEAYPAAGGERYVVGDLFQPPPEWEASFDGVLEHTCFCAIDPARRADYVRSVHRLLRPGGTLLAIFFLNPDHDGDGPPYGTTREELDRLFTPWFQLREEAVPEATHPGREDRELLRRLERA